MIRGIYHLHIIQARTSFIMRCPCPIMDLQSPSMRMHDEILFKIRCFNKKLTDTRFVTAYFIKGKTIKLTYKFIVNRKRYIL